MKTNAIPSIGRKVDVLGRLQAECLNSANAPILQSVLRVLKSIKRDTAALVRFAIEPEGRNVSGAMSLSEPRLRQVTRVAEVMQEHPTWTLHRACLDVLKNMPIEGGYNCIGGLYRYCHKHSYDTRG